MPDDFDPENPTDDLTPLYARPGFMIRRAHQIAQTIFLEENNGITPTQYGVMRILWARPELDQVSVARLLGQDRSTAALVLKKLTKDGLVERRDATDDRRRKVLTLTPKGAALLVDIRNSVRRSHAKLLSAFTKKDAAEFLRLLELFVSTFNSKSRTPLETGARHPSPRRRRKSLPPGRISTTP